MPKWVGWPSLGTEWKQSIQANTQVGLGVVVGQSFESSPLFASTCLWKQVHWGGRGDGVLGLGEKGNGTEV